MDHLSVEPEVVCAHHWPVAFHSATDEPMKATSQPGGKGQPLTWRTVVKRAAPVALAVVAFYLVLPRVTAVLGAWPSLSALNPVWFGAAVAAEGLSLACAFALQRLALGTSKWYAVITSGLTGNAITNAIPGGDAVGAAVQFRMLGKAGIDADAAVSGLGTFSFLQVGGLLALPIFSVPAILFGTPVPRGLLDSALLGIAGFALFAGCSVLLLRTSRPLELFGRGIQWLWNNISRRKPPLTGLDQRLLHDRERRQDGAGHELAAGRRTFHRSAGVRLRLPVGRSARDQVQPTPIAAWLTGLPAWSA